MNIGNLLGAMGKVPSKKGVKVTPEMLCMWEKRSDDEDKPKRFTTLAMPEPPEVLCVRFSPDNTILAAGCGDGIVRLYKAENGQFYGTLGGNKLKAKEDRLPNMCIRWKPQGGAAGSSKDKGKNTLLVGNADGTVEHYDIVGVKGSCTSCIQEEGNSVLAVDYSPDASRFATGGKDRIVRVYDETHKNCFIELRGMAGSGHSNRILAVRLPNRFTVVSGGLDGTVKVWGLRGAWGDPTHTISGVNVSGDAIEGVGP